MACPPAKPNYITACNLGQCGDKEFIVACKGRPFSILTSPQFPVPTVNYVDYNLIRDLKLCMTDLQCTRLSYAGGKFRILGKISTSVQCIVDGAPLGNMHFKAHVVEDLQKHFNTHGIAGDKLYKKLIGPSLQLVTEDASTEPTVTAEKEKKQKKKRKRKDEHVVPVQPKKQELSSPPRPICQGNWTKLQSYRGWHPQHGYGGPPGVLRVLYQDRRTDEVQGEIPDCWDSEGTIHSEDSASSIFSSSDEYDDDEYTNISSVRQNDAAVPDTNKLASDAVQNAHPPPFLSVTEARAVLTANAADPASPTSVKKMIIQNCKKAGMDRDATIEALQCAGYTIRVRHGPDRCDARCAVVERVPAACGYHPRWGQIISCSPDCNGGYCNHHDPEYDYSEEDRML